MNIVKWIIGIVICMAAFFPLVLIAFSLILGYGFDPYGNLYHIYQWLGLSETLEIIMSISIIVLAIRLPLRHFGVDRRKDKLFIGIFIAFIVAAMIILCYLMYIYSGPIHRR